MPSNSLRLAGLSIFPRVTLNRLNSGLRLPTPELGSSRLMQKNSLNPSDRLGTTSSERLAVLGLGSRSVVPLSTPMADVFGVRVPGLILVQPSKWNCRYGGLSPAQHR